MVQLARLCALNSKALKACSMLCCAYWKQVALFAPLRFSKALKATVRAQLLLLIVSPRCCCKSLKVNKFKGPIICYVIVLNVFMLVTLENWCCALLLGLSRQQRMCVMNFLATQTSKGRVHAECTTPLILRDVDYFYWLKFMLIKLITSR